MEIDTRRLPLHIGIAERGKMYNLEGNYKEALRYYREAMRLTQNKPESEIFFQHYSQCIMEALELSGAYDEVIMYCEKCIGFLESKDINSEIVIKFKASILERQAIQYLLKKDKVIALELLKNTQSTIGKGNQPLTDELLNWTIRGLNISIKQLRDSQRKHKYFIVRREKINPDIAIDLPKSVFPF